MMNDLNYFLPGQVWQYDTRPGDEHSTITILKIDELDEDAIIHIRIENIDFVTGGCIQHLPFSADSIMASVTDFIKHLDAVPDFAAGYQQWKEAYDAKKAGYWTIPVKQAVDAVYQVMNKKDQ